MTNTVPLNSEEELEKILATHLKTAWLQKQYDTVEVPSFGLAVHEARQAILALITAARIDENQRWANGYASALHDYPDIDDPQSLQAAKLDFEDRIKELQSTLTNDKIGGEHGDSK